MRPPRGEEQGADGAPSESPQHQRPIAQSENCQDEGPARDDQGFRSIRPGEPAKVEIPHEQGPRQDLQGAGEEREAGDEDNPADRRLVEEGRHRGSHHARDADEATPEEQREPSEARDLVLVQVAARDDGGSQPELVHELHEAEIDQRHSHEAIVRRREQPRDHQRGRPAKQLCGPARSAGPGNAAQQRLVEFSCAGLGGERGRDGYLAHGGPAHRVA